MPGVCLCVHVYFFVYILLSTWIRVRFALATISFMFVASRKSWEKRCFLGFYFTWNWNVCSNRAISLSSMWTNECIWTNDNNTNTEMKQKILSNTKSREKTSPYSHEYTSLFIVCIMDSKKSWRNTQIVYSIHIHSIFILLGSPFLPLFLACARPFARLLLWFCIFILYIETNEKIPSWASLFSCKQQIVIYLLCLWSVRIVDVSACDLGKRDLKKLHSQMDLVAVTQIVALSDTLENQLCIMMSTHTNTDTKHTINFKTKRSISEKLISLSRYSSPSSFVEFFDKNTRTKQENSVQAFQF